MEMHIRPAIMTVTKNCKILRSKMADNGHLKNKINRDISETVWPILTEFCKMAHISPPELTSSSKTQTLKIQDGGRPPF